MRRPLTFAWRNVVFAGDVHDAWALFRLHVTSYPGLPRSGKVELLSRLAAYAAASEADFQILRLSRGWSGATTRKPRVDARQRARTDRMAGPSARRASRRDRS